jgi:hypothetical protein
MTPDIRSAVVSLQKSRHFGVVAPILLAALCSGTADVLDHVTSDIAAGSRSGIDATKRLAGESFKRLRPRLVQARFNREQSVVKCLS